MEPDEALERGFALLDMGRLEDALAHLRRAAAAAPDLSQIHALIASAELQLGHAKQALEAAEAAVQTGPEEELGHRPRLRRPRRDRGSGLNRGTADPADDVEAIMTPSGTLTGLGARAGYPQLVVPAGYSAASRDPVGIAFNGTAHSEAKLLAFGYAYEQATKLRKPPSETNPSLWRCVPGNAYIVTTRACAPSTPTNADAAAATIGGTVPATLSLVLGAPATFGAFTPGVAKSYTASTIATVVSTAGDAAITVTDPSTNRPGYLVNGAFALPQPLQGLGVVKSYSGPASNDVVTITFTQPIGSTDSLRTGAYSKTLTFTLSTTMP